MTLPETSLQSLRNLARDFSETAYDREFVTDNELNRYLNLGIRELYDLLLESHGQEYFLKCVEIPLVGSQVVYELPGDMSGLKRVDWSTDALPSVLGVLGETGIDDVVTPTFDVPMYDTENACPIFPYDFDDPYKDSLLAQNSSNWGSRTGSDLKYRVLASNKSVAVTAGPGNLDELEGTLLSTTVTRVNLIRLNQDSTGYLYVWYWPEAPLLDDDADVFPFFHGMEEFPALIAAIMVKAKMESDTGDLQNRADRIRDRIAKMASNRDIDHPEQMGDVMGGYND